MPTMRVVKHDIVEEIVPPDYQANYFGIEWLRTDDLIIDRAYQRPIRNALVRIMKDSWDWRAVRTLAVSLRKDEETGANFYAVIDGQQRLTGARELNIEELPCQIYVDLTLKEEAELFLKLNNSSKPNANDMFRAAIIENQEEARVIMGALKDTNWQLNLEANRSHKKVAYAAFEVTSATALLKTYREGGYVHLRSVLQTLSGWKGQHMAGSSDMMLGMSSFLLRHRGKVDMTKFTDKLSKTTPGNIVGQAAQLQAAERNLGSDSRTRSRCIERVMTAIYNKGNRSGKLEG